ncbi:MAG TPA: hypothetical protein VHG71_04565 [Verrucomicrobiae bacterium]|nr:hypothetical protein [Verrucomicrobiae bacterium]
MSDAEKNFWKAEMDKEEKQAKDFEQQIKDVGPHDGHGNIGGMTR